MKLKFVCFYFILKAYSLVAYGQCAPEINITGNTCVGDILTANSNMQGASIIWKKDGVSVSTQPALIVNAGITAAGGKGNGNAANQLSNPNRIYIDATGNLYIPDMSNSRIQKWMPGATSGITVAGGNGIGSAANQFDRPTSVALDSKGDIYVTDQSNGRIQKWVPGATTGITVAKSLSYPTGIFIDAQDNIYVSEQNASLVSKWTPGATSGIVVAGGNGYGAGANQLSAPTGIFLDAAGNIYICDTDNNRIQKWSPGATSGSTVAGGNGFGSSPNQLSNPLGIYVDASANLYISDFNNYRVQKWSPGSTSGTTVAGGNGSGSGSNQLNQPAGIYMDAACNLYVSDFYNNRVQKFVPKAINTYTTIAPGDYTASLITTSGVTVTSNKITVTASQKAELNIVADKTTICQGMAAMFTAIPTNGGVNPTLQWKKNGLDVGANATTYSDNNLVNGDLISCVLKSNASCLLNTTAASNIVSITVQNAPGQVSLGADMNVCPGEKITLDAGASYSSYLWQDGSTNSTFTASNGGLYHVKVQNDCGFATDTILVTYYPEAVNFLPDNTRLCINSSVELKSTVSFKKYLWNNNEVTPAIDVNSEGMYWLQGTDENNCISRDTVIVTKGDCVKKMYVPNSFTPNNDGRNEQLKPIFFFDPILVRFDVYNRWGQLVFRTNNNKAWDGKLNGEIQSQGVFIWICTYQFRGEPIKTEKGTVTLIR